MACEHTWSSSEYSLVNQSASSRSKVWAQSLGQSGSLIRSGAMRSFSIKHADSRVSLNRLIARPSVCRSELWKGSRARRSGVPAGLWGNYKGRGVAAHPGFLEPESLLRRRRYTQRVINWVALCNTFGVNVFYSAITRGGAPPPRGFADLGLWNVTPSA